MWIYGFKNIGVGILVLVSLLLLLLLSLNFSRHRREDSNLITVARKQCEALCISLEMFHFDCGRYPTDLEGFSALYESFDIPGWRGPYLTVTGSTGNTPPIDPWRQPFVYRKANGRAFVISKGPDLKESTIDDIVVPLDK
jgi:general secretion pathway protein G